MSILLDSDVVIEVLRARDSGILDQWTLVVHRSANLLVSPVTVAEVWAGALPAEHTAISRFFALVPCVPLDQETGRAAGDFLRQFSRSHGLKIADALIAATATRHKAALWTRNRKHYPMTSLVFHT